MPPPRGWSSGRADGSASSERRYFSLQLLEAVQRAIEVRLRQMLLVDRHCHGTFGRTLLDR
jgi:hypothetical protein